MIILLIIIPSHHTASPSKHQSSWSWAIPPKPHSIHTKNNPSLRARHYGLVACADPRYQPLPKIPKTQSLPFLRSTICLRTPVFPHQLVKYTHSTSLREPRFTVLRDKAMWPEPFNFLRHDRHGFGPDPDRPFRPLFEVRARGPSG